MITQLHRLTASWYISAGSTVSWLPCKCSSLKLVSCPHSGAIVLSWLPFTVSLSKEPAGMHAANVVQLSMVLTSLVRQIDKA